MRVATTTLIAFLFVASGGLVSKAASIESPADRPNVVMIMTDNHGAWTLGCYGNDDIRTPHIDQLASEGTLFENAFASNPVCSPTRATVLTGLIPSQHGVHCFLRGGHLQVGPNARCTLDEFRSLPEILKDAGYQCGLVGKWHLGANLTPQEGFDDYWITMPHGGTSTFYDADIIEEGKIRSEPKYLTDFWTQHALQFLKQQSDERPFFLFLSYNGPYSLGRLLLREGRNRHADYYRDKSLPSFPREKTHPWQLHNRDYINNPVSIQRVATEVSGVDDGVGAVMAALKSSGFDDNTIVIFLADQGWVGGHGGFFGMGDHTRPVTAVDGMMRIPMIWRQPGKVAANRRSDTLVANYDVLPTLLAQLGLPDEQPEQSPGSSFAAEFDVRKKSSTSLGRNAEPSQDAVFYEFESLRCIRTQQWKYTHRFPNGPHELFDLQNDPEEFVNLFHEAEHQTVARVLKQRLDEFFGKHADPRFDLWNGGGSQTAIYDGVEEELAQLAAVAPPELPESFQPHSFALPEGFIAELAAGPPLVSHPTMGCFDDRGRFFVCNNAGVNMSAEELEQHLPNSIRMLEDQDGDGVFDRSTVFADNMTFPMGGAWYDGALYVASPPSIWRLEDTDGDGVADKRDAIVDKFGYTGNAASIHGCFFSPDGRLYWCDGYHGHEFKDDSGAVTSKRSGSYLFSCRPDGSDVRIHCGGGMDNPVEVDFTDAGEVIGTVNILYTRPRVDCLVHWQYGGAYPHREAVLDELHVTGPLLTPMHQFGHVAVSGTTRYRSGVMDHRWRDNFFATFFNLGRVVRVELERSGSSFTPRQREFLSCDSRDFHPTDVVEDADGSLLVIDTGGWFYRGCPTSQIARPDIPGGIYRIRRRGMTTLPDPRGRQIDWSQRSLAELMRDLKDTRIPVCEAAICECVRRGADAVPRLAATVRSADIRARRNGIYALTRIVSADSGQQAALASAATARRAIRDALQDRHPQIRQVACHAITVNPDSLAIPELTLLLHDESGAVRREALVALGRIGDAAAIPEIVVQLGDADRNISHAAAYALIEIGDARPIADAVADSANPATVIRARMAMLQIAPEQFTSHGQPICEWPGDEDLQREMLLFYQHVLRHARQHPEIIGGAFPSETNQLFSGLVEQVRSNRASHALLADYVARFAGVPEVAAAVGKLLEQSATSTAMRSALLSGIAASQVPIDESWAKPLVDEINSADEQRVQTALKSIASVRSDAFRPHVLRLTKESNIVAIQLSAVETIVNWDRRLPADLFEMLVEMTASQRPDRSVRAAALLGAAALSRQQLGIVAGLLPNAGPQQLVDLVRLFRSTGDAETATAFLAGLEQSRSFASLPMLELSEVVKRFPQELHSRANSLLDSLKAAENRKLQKLDSLVRLVPEGDPVRGKKLFFGDKSKCSTCHIVGREGKRVGPDLTKIGASRSPQDLAESIVFPSATIVRQYEPYSVLMKSGRNVSGLVIADAPDSVTIQPTTGEPVRISRAEIEEMVAGTVSVMPRGLDESLSPQELADLIAWLQTLR